MQVKSIAKRNPLAVVLLWVFFSVVIGGVLPICSDLLISTVLEKPFSLQEALSHGALLMVAVALVSDVFSDLYTGSRLATNGIDMILVVGGLGVLLSSCIVFGCLSAIDIGTSNLHFSRVFVMWFSLGVFSLALVVGGASKWRNR